jgi:hypothetical protein
VSETSIARLTCTYALPRDRELMELRARLDRVLESRLAGAVATALAPLDDADPGAVWVVRTLRAEAVVSATDDDLDALAAQWGTQLAGGIMDAIRRGPGGNVVRFASRAEYLASFAAALAERRAHTWVFEPLAGLRLLAPATAIRVGAESAGLRAAEAVAELATLRKVETVLAVSSPPEVAALWAACLGDSVNRVAGAELVERVAAAAALSSVRTAPAEYCAARAVRTFAAVAASVGRGPDVVAAVDALVRRDAAQPPRRRVRAGEEPAASRTPRGRDYPEAPEQLAQPAASEPLLEADVFAAAGAPAFMVLPSLEAVGLADATAAARAHVLTRLLGVPFDEAVLLAAGVEDEDLDEDVDGDALIGLVLVALEADDRPESAQRVREADTDPLDVVARAAIEQLARRLLSFERASTAYLVERFLPPGGVVTVTADTIHAELQPPPLAVVLVMAGLDEFAYRVPWLEQDVVVMHRAG